MDFMNKNGRGLALCLAIAVPAWYLGKLFPIIGGAVISILLGMLITLLLKDKSSYDAGIKYTSKKILQLAVIMLGFGMNLSVIIQTGKESLPIIISTIATSLIVAYVLHKLMHIPTNIATLVGVGSSICGGSAIAATAPVIKASDEEVAQGISIIFFFNVLAALVFPLMGEMLGFSHTGDAFGVFAGTAVNDTSSVTAAAATWDSMWGLGTDTLDIAVTVKLTRTLAIIPITLGLAYIFTKNVHDGKEHKVSLSQIFPTFILFFILASVITTVAIAMGVDKAAFHPIKELSKFLIVLAMAAIGLNTNIVKLIKTGGKPIVLGFCCWTGITMVCIAMQYYLGIW